MTSTLATIAEEVDRYLRTGETDPYYSAWPGNFLERARRAEGDLRGGLVRGVRRRSEGRMHRPLPQDDFVVLTRRKVEPMVRGLFPRAEQDAVLRALETSVVFVTAENVESVLLAERYERTAWDLANLYLASLGADMLGPGAQHILGLSLETTCYVSVGYFDEAEPFDDVLLHEVSHVFHNCKRATVGLTATRTREWLLDIDIAKRETFAYACEAYGRILERARNRTEHTTLADEFAATVRTSDSRVDDGELATIVRDAVAARNGWKVILACCVPRKTVTRSAGKA